MKIVVVYESMFGNTKTVAEDIAAGLGETEEVRIGSVDEIAPDGLRDAALIVIGGPTQSRGLARPETRRSLAGAARLKYGPVLPGRLSLAGWLDQLGPGATRAAAFDTRFGQPMLISGSASKLIANRLQSKGYSLVSRQSFIVRGTGGPLADGERARARTWGRELAAAARATAAA